MKILVTGPCYYPLKAEGYGGMEKLTYLLAREWGKKHEVKVVGGKGSQIPEVEVYEGSQIGSFQEAEAVAWREWGWVREWADVVVDFSHGHYFRRDGFPGVSWIWHDPKMMQPEVPSSMLYALSGWQAERHQEMTGQKIGVLDCICADPLLYRYDAGIAIGDRWVSIGILDANKGQRQCAEIAEEAGIGLDIIGKSVDDKIVGSIQQIQERTHGRVRYLGELPDQEKNARLRAARGLLYWPSYPEGFGEAHSHKMVEALMMGVPCVVRDQGAMREIFGKRAGVAVMAAQKEAQDIMRIYPAGKMEELRWAIAEFAAECWAVPNVAQRILQEVVCKASA